MTNDYLFRALLQRNNRVLKSLIRSLLHLMLEEIISVEIANAIELGAAVEEKEFIRSTCYLCRTYSNLNHGDDYTSAKSVIQIGLLDFTLFPERPEFYAAYKLINEKNFSVYSDKLRLSVLDLTRTDLATEEDRRYGIDAAVWERRKMQFLTSAHT